MLAEEFKKPFVNVHHLEAHCLMARLAGTKVLDRTSDAIKRNDAAKQNDAVDPYLVHHVPTARYPFLALLVSGGHTSILLCKDLGEYEVLGGTLDDSLGEGFDKVARLIGLRMAGSGGAAVESLARKGDIGKYPMKVPMKDKNNCDFSYAGKGNSITIYMDSPNYSWY